MFVIRFIFPVSLPVAHFDTCVKVGLAPSSLFLIRLIEIHVRVYSYTGSGSLQLGHICLISIQGIRHSLWNI